MHASASRGDSLPEHRSAPELESFSRCAFDLHLFSSASRLHLDVFNGRSSLYTCIVDTTEEGLLYRSHLYPEMIDFWWMQAASEGVEKSENSNSEDSGKHGFNK